MTKFEKLISVGVVALALLTLSPLGILEAIIVLP